MDNYGQNNFCKSCGTPLTPGTRFCPGCGAPVDTNVQQPQQNVNPYAQQPEQNVNPYAQQPEQSVNPYAQQPEQNVNPYAQQPEQSVNPYAQQPEQSVNPYAQQPEQSVNPYAQQSEQNVNPYAQQPEQNVNPYAQQPEQNVNPYAQQSEQNVNPYAQQFEQGVNSYGQQTGYNGMTTTQSDFTAPKKRSKKPFIIAGSAILGVAAVAVVGVMIFNMFKPSNPIDRIADGAKALTQANSATISLSLDYDGSEMNVNGSYEIDREKKEIVAVLNGNSTFKPKYTNSITSDQNLKMIIYCKDGIRRTGISNGDSDMIYSEIKQKDIDEFFDNLDNVNTKKWDNAKIDDELKEYIYVDKIEEVSQSLLDAYKSSEGQKALGIEESSENGNTKFSFNIKPYDTLKIALDEVEPLLKDTSTLNDFEKQLDENKGTLDSVNIKFDISLDGSGNLSGFSFDSFGVKADLKILNVNSTKVELSSSEIDEIKNAEIASDDFDLDDYENSYLPDYYNE